MLCIRTLLRTTVLSFYWIYGNT